MAVDRGELRYKIAIEDEFTKPIQRFRTELLKAKNTLDFVRDAGAGFNQMSQSVAQSTAQIRRFRQASSQNSSQEAAANREAQQRLREISAEQKKRLANEKLRADILKAQRADAERTAKAERLAAAEAEKTQRRAALATRQHANEQRGLGKSLFDTGTKANRLTFTFRRLFGALAAFTLIREVSGAFVSLLGSGVQFNRTIEESRIGLAGLFTAIGQVTDLAGNLQTGPDAFATALTVADEQMVLLQADALKTTASFEQLLEVFQVAVGPGLAAGLQIDEIRQVSTLVSQAATALRISQDQLSEEIRALLTGAGTQRTSRIFTALGFSGPEIEQAKQAGTLFQLLETRLRAFGKAAEAAQNTMTGLNQRLREAISLTAGRASIGFFLELKDLLKELGDAFVTVQRDSEGVIQKITPRPEAVQTLAILFSGLQDAVATIRAGIQELSLTQIQQAVAGLANAFRVLSVVAVGIVRGLISGFSDVAVITQRLFGAFDAPVVREIVALFVRLGTLAGSLSISLFLATSAARLLLSPLFLVFGILKNILSTVTLALNVIGKIPAKLIPWVAALGLVFAGFKKVFELILDMPVSITDTAKIIGLSFANLFQRIFLEGKIIFKELGNSIVAFFQDPIAFIARQFSALFSGILQLVSGFAAILGIAEDFRVEVEAGIAALDGFANNKPEPFFNTGKDREDLFKFIVDSKRAINDLGAEIGRKSAARDFDISPKFDGEEATLNLKSLLADINAEITGLIGGDIVDTEAITKKLEALTADLQKRLGNVTAGAVEENEKLVLTSFGNLIVSSAKFIDLLTNMTRAFADFAATAIVDAFDPTKDTDLVEAFARFLQDIAKQILQMLISLVVATAIAKAFGVPLTADKSPPPISELNAAFPFAEGGEVPNSPHGGPRPAGIPASDTVAAFLTPGEVVQSLAAVRKYGADFLLALNAGAIDPFAIRALQDGLGSRRNVRRSVARSGAMAFASGGLVPATPAAQATRDAAVSQTEAQPPIALVVGNEQSLDRLLAGGRKAMLDFINANAGSIAGSLSKVRT
jgi:hypothetical protein